MAVTGEYRWSGVRSPSVERLALTIDGDVHARSVVQTEETEYAYDVILDAGWAFQTLRLNSADGRHLGLRRDGASRWAQDGNDRPDLAGAFDIDLAFSPFTNTLPIRRLDLPVGGAAEIVVAYVDAPSLAVLPDPQRYTRLGYTRLAVDQYLFESLDSGFTREITVDSECLVLDYPGLFTRRADTR